MTPDSLYAALDEPNADVDLILGLIADWHEERGDCFRAECLQWCRPGLRCPDRGRHLPRRACGEEGGEVMGMHADDAIDECLHMEDLRDRFRHGMMSDVEAFELGILDEFGSSGSSAGPSLKQCRCCGKRGLKWGIHAGYWRLFDGGQLHNCSVNPLRKKAVQP